MKKVFFTLLLPFFLFGGCTPTKWFLVNSEGIATYNKITREFEFMWNWRSMPLPKQTDTLCIDSLSKKK